MNTNLRIGDVLKEKGYVTDEQMNQALAYQKEHQAAAARRGCGPAAGGCEGRSHGKQRACGKESPASYQCPGASYGAGG